MSGGDIRLRRATFADLPDLGPLIAASARELSRSDYTPEQVEGALRGAFGTDTQLIRDGSYFVIEAGGRLAGCGGWSRRRTLFGSDARSDRDSTELDPATDAAKIRAFFIHPDFARRGLGTLLLDRCEQAAVAHGFRRFELMATLPGVRLYAARGYQAGARIEWPVGDGVAIPFVPMTKDAPPSPYRVERATPRRRDGHPRAAEARLSIRSAPVRRLDAAAAHADAGKPARRIRRFRGAESDEAGRLVGSVRAREADGVCQVGRLIVHPELQGRGVGTMLMRHIEAEFPRRAAFELFTGSRSEGNLRLYERLGYARSREKVLSPSVTLVFLEKRR